MKAFLIDPTTKGISETTFDGDYKSIYKAIDATTFEAVRINEAGDVIYLDEEGLLKDDPGPFFTVGNVTVAGKGLVLGTDGEGETVAPTITIEALTAMIGFPDLTFTGFGPASEGEVDHPVFGKTWMIDAGKPQFVKKEKA